MKTFARLTKQRSGFWFVRRHDGRLWQPGYYDRVLRTDEATEDVLKYIVENPVRGGIVASPIEYAFWGSGVYTREQLLEFIQDAGSWNDQV